MTIKNDLYVYMVKGHSKRIKRVKLKKLIDNINLECFTKKFFTSEKDAKNYIKNEKNK
jgi:hypothetical protein